MIKEDKIVGGNDNIVIKKVEKKKDSYMMITMHTFQDDKIFKSSVHPPILSSL